MNALTGADIQSAWDRGSLQKGSVKSPGLPVAPHPPKPRAPRQPSPVDPVEGKKPSAPYKFRPHTRGDLYELHLHDRYDIQRQKSTRYRGSKPPAAPHSPFRRLLTNVRGLVSPIGRRVGIPSFAAKINF